MKQYFELAMIFIRKIFSLNLSVEQIQKLIEDKKHPFWVGFNELTKTLISPPVVSPESLGDLVDRAQQELFAPWVEFYKTHFNIDLDMNSVKIPNRVSGFNYLIVVADVGLDQVWEVCEKQFNCWKCLDSNLDCVVTKNDRNPKSGAYAVWVRGTVEGDEEMKNLSANDLAKQNVKGITLLERLLLELKCFSETRKHLDVKNATLCSGSRTSVGSVPSLRWVDDRLFVDWYSVSSSWSDLRSRVVVTV